MMATPMYARPTSEAANLLAKLGMVFPCQQQLPTVATVAVATDRFAECSGHLPRLRALRLNLVEGRQLAGDLIAVGNVHCLRSLERSEHILCWRHVVPFPV
jgi:hypothetical protein